MSLSSKYSGPGWGEVVLHSPAMKLLHRPNLYGWSSFDQARNIDFNSVFWVRRTDDGENAHVAIDPLPLTEHDWDHLMSLGGLRTIILTNSDHVRDALELRRKTGAKIYGPAAERESFPISCDEWLAAGDQHIADLVVRTVSGSKTPGELALLLEGTTLVTGDLIRSHAGGRLDLLPTHKLTDLHAALQSVRELLAIDRLEAVLPGDGWPVFRGGRQLLEELVARLEQEIR